MKERRCHMSDSHSLMSQRVQFIIRVTTEQIRTEILDPQGSWYKYQQPWYNHVKLMNHINTRFVQHYSIRVYPANHKAYINALRTHTAAVMHTRMVNPLPY
jgi:hypothetical protein